MADPRNPMSDPAGPAAHDDAGRIGQDHDLGLGYGGSDGEQGRRAGPLYDPGPEPGLGFGGSEDRGRGAFAPQTATATGDRSGGAASGRGGVADDGMEGAAIGAPNDLINATRVKGTDVYNHDGEHLGHIDDVVLSKREGRVVYAIMSFGGFLGMGEQYHPLPWDQLDYDPGRGGYIVRLSRAQLEGAPSYRPGEEPDWNDADYGGTVTRYFVPPLL